MKSLCLLIMLGMAQPLMAQAPPRPATPPELQVEQARIQAEERQRREIEMRDWVTQIFQVKNIAPGNLRQALSMFRAEMSSEPTLRVLSVRAPKEIMPAIAEAVAMLDVPQPPAPSNTAELTVYVLLAKPQEDPSVTVPAVLRPVVDQLKNVMTYRSYNVIDTIITKGGGNLRSISGGVLPPLYRNSGQPSEYQFSAILFVDTTEGKPPVLSVRDMRFELKVDIGNAVSNPGLSPDVAVGPALFANPTIRTTVEIPAGQQIVVGKATLGDNALILVMSAKFVD